MPVAKSKRFAHTGRRPNEERRQAVATLYRSGLSIHAVSELIGVSPQAVHSMLQRMGVQLRARGGNQGSHSRHRK
jgi:transposase-like protein